MASKASEESDASHPDRTTMARNTGPAGKLEDSQIMAKESKVHSEKPSDVAGRHENERSGVEKVVDKILPSRKD